MASREDAVVEVLTAASALGVAMLANDFDEARSITRRLATTAVDAQLDQVAPAAEQLTAALGPAGTAPKTGYGTQLLFLANAIREATQPTTG